jgi:hypothetical protein
MNIITHPRPTVNPSRPFTRPVKTAEHVEAHYSSVAGLGFLLIVGTAPKVKSYEVRPIESDFGRAFAVRSRVEGKEYSVLIDGHNSACDCPGHVFTGGCKHLSGLLTLIAGGRL